MLERLRSWSEAMIGPTTDSRQVANRVLQNGLELSSPVIRRRIWEVEKKERISPSSIQRRRRRWLFAAQAVQKTAAFAAITVIRH